MGGTFGRRVDLGRHRIHRQTLSILYRSNVGIPSTSTRSLKQSQRVSLLYLASRPAGQYRVPCGLAPLETLLIKTNHKQVLWVINKHPPICYELLLPWRTRRQLE